MNNGCHPIVFCCPNPLQDISVLMLINEYMILSHYKLRGIHFVNLADRYAVAGSLLGKSFYVRYSEHIIVNLVFPSIINEESFPDLGIMGLLERYGIDEDDWGAIKSYYDIKKPETLVAWISKVLVEYYSDDASLELSANSIETMGDKLVHAIQILNPNAVRVPRDDRKNEICEVKTSVDIGLDGNPHVGIALKAIIDDRKGALTFSDIKLGIKNIYNSITAPYEMLDNARRNFDHHDTRASVLNCATAIEVSLKRIVLGYLESSMTLDPIKEFIMKQADGFSKLVGLCKRFCLPIDTMPNVQKTVFTIRDRVIHGGYVPTYQEAQTALDNTRDTLKALNVPMFE